MVIEQKKAKFYPQRQCKKQFYQQTVLSNRKHHK